MLETHERDGGPYNNIASTTVPASGAALRAPDSFGAFLAIGLTTMITIQALVNISVVLSLMPTKGIPLPFVSFGGSSLLMNLIGMGILLNVSQQTSIEA